MYDPLDRQARHHLNSKSRSFRPLNHDRRSLRNRQHFGRHLVRPFETGTVIVMVMFLRVHCCVLAR